MTYHVTYSWIIFCFSKSRYMKFNYPVEFCKSLNDYHNAVGNYKCLLTSKYLLEAVAFMFADIDFT